jgi:hypothetical protein
MFPGVSAAASGEVAVDTPIASKAAIDIFGTLTRWIETISGRASVRETP